MPEVMIIDLPPVHGAVRGPWYQGFPVHQGETPASLNFATVYANQHQIIPNPQRITAEHTAFKAVLKQAGFRVRLVPFPKVLNQPTSLHHDAVFIRDAGFGFQNTWIPARFSATSRQPEADTYAQLMGQVYHREIVPLPPGAFLEFGEVFYVKTKRGRYYFGGLGRSNAAGHNFVRSHLKPDQFLLIRSQGYHLDTVFSPVLNLKNELVAVLVAVSMIAPDSLQQLQKLPIEIISVDPIDASGEGDWLGNYAVNALVGPGVLVNGAPFCTPGVEDRLAALGITRYTSPLASFRWAGGSYHCLTNQWSDEVA